jgi:hypothetical protein
MMSLELLMAGYLLTLINDERHCSSVMNTST